MNRAFHRSKIYTGAFSCLPAYLVQAFRLLPLAFVVNNKAFVVHGGLSRQKDVTLDDIRKIDRNKEPGSDGGSRSFGGRGCRLVWLCFVHCLQRNSEA